MPRKPIIISYKKLLLPLINVIDQMPIESERMIFFLYEIPHIIRYNLSREAMKRKKTQVEEKKVMAKSHTVQQLTTQI